MKRIGRELLCVVAVFGQLQFIVPIARAVDAPPLVISHVLAGESGTGNTNSELIAIYNNAGVDIDVTGYCIKNIKTPANPVLISCISGQADTKVYIPSHAYLTIASTVFTANHLAATPTGHYEPDTSFVSTNSITVTSGVLGLFNSSNQEIDRLEWGVSGAPNLDTGKTLRRISDPVAVGQLKDTNNMLADLIAESLTSYPLNASYDVKTIIDICPNIPDTQPVMPVNYLADENGNCQPDSCLNLMGLQVSIPDNYDADVNGNCTAHDECDNLSGIQTVIPGNMIRANINDCTWDIVPLVLSELLPNAIGTDTSNEFIEIYNPSDQTIDLSLYSVKIGVNGEKAYAFPIGATIAPGEYRTFSDSVMKFTLVNTTSRVMLTAIDGSTLGDSGIYENALEGEAWAWIDNNWEYTNRSTPGTQNAASVYPPEEEKDITDTPTVVPCPAGKYRNPLTNRCRLIENDAAVLANCDTDQYRNPETGRCRKITTVSLTPCKDGQYRSEETNRCRNILTASTQKPCKDDQYRSEETNRCRTIAANSIPGAGFAVQSVKDSGSTFVGWWALGGVALLAVGYGAWEWRREIVKLWLRIFPRSF